MYLYLKNTLIITNFTRYTDQELLTFVQQKNEKAFNTLYHRYYLPLSKKAFQRIPTMSRVEEIVQDVFINLWTKAVTLDANGNVKAYLYATLRNKILHEMRTESTRLFYAEKIKKVKQKQAKTSFIEALYAKETETHIAQLIRTLSPQCREAFRLSRFESLSYKEIAEHMHLSVSTVEKHVGKALRVLREQLSKYESSLPFLLLFLPYFF